MSRLDSSRPGTRGHHVLAALGLALLAPATITGCPFKADVFTAYCFAAEDCDDGNQCTVDTCDNGSCNSEVKSKGTVCGSDKKSVCDGEDSPSCVECLKDNDCVVNHTATPICDLEQQKCVSCIDGEQNGKETGIDCGGPDCGACLGQACDPMDVEKGCGNLNGSKMFCVGQDGICCESACVGKCESCLAAKTGKADGTCAPVPFSQDPDGECAGLGGCGETMGLCACQDGVKNGTETDVDCGGGACSACGGGKTCLVESDCAATVPVCVSGACCNSLCELPCSRCDATGTCGFVPAGFEDNFCGTTKACGANGAGCVGKAGAACAVGAQCLSGACSGGMCAPSAAGKPCSTSADCAGGNCVNYICQ